ncbi:hypothetical protein [Ligilactobacillus aviarius]|uniref:hypothetical protein n=1 Tax=Ligilactobacillus aviarius TaxID=1606 RepID=UPI00255BD0A5|nr:hypothetical protein [Ligilactobacillus aviarius]
MKKIVKNIKLLSIFILLSFVALLPFFKANLISSGVDLAFHLNRIVNLSETLQHGKLFSFISTWGLNGIGVPINMAYGCLPLYPFAVLFVILRNKILAYYLGIMFWMVVSGIISYTFSYKYYKNSTKAFLFSVVYTFANYLFGNFFGIGDIGQAVAWIFMPMMVWGCYSSFIQKGKKREWYYTPLALTAIIYSHVISTLIAISIVGIFLVVAFVEKEKLVVKLKLLIKQILFTLGTTLFYWINLFFVLRSKASIPSCSELSGIDVGNFIQQQFTWGGNRVGALVAIIFVIGLFNWKKMSRCSKGTAIIALIYSFLMTNISTVFLIVLSHTSFRMIQWTGRLAGAVNLFSILFDIDVIILLLKNLRLKKVGYIGIIGIFLISFIGQGITFINNPNLKPVDYSATLNKQLPFGNWKINSNKGVCYMTAKDYMGVGALDYWPSRSLKFRNGIINNDVIVNGKIENISIKRRVDEFILSGADLKQGEEVNTPILYNSQFKVLQNGKESLYKQSYRGTVLFKINEKNSNYPVIIKYSVPKLTKISAIISIIMLFILLIIVLK